MIDTFNFGDTVRDKYSGFQGIVDGYAEYANGCIRVRIQPRVDKDGKYVNAEWIDIQQLEVVKSSKKKKTSKASGGPTYDPPRETI